MSDKKKGESRRTKKGATDDASESDSSRTKTEIDASPVSEQPNAKAKYDLEIAKLANATAARKIDGVISVSRTCVRSVVWISGFYFLYAIASVLAGKTTSVSSVLSAVVDMSADRWAAWGLVVLLSGGYYHQLRLRRNTIQGQSAYIKELEAKIDARRSTSGLTDTGERIEEERDAL